MCQALNDLVDAWYGDRLKKEVAEEVAKEIAKEMAIKLPQEVAKEVAKTKATTLIALICKKHKKKYTETEIAEALETDIGFVQQICQVISELSGDYTHDDIYTKWSTAYSVD